MEGFNLLWKLAKANRGALVARELAPVFQCSVLLSNFCAESSLAAGTAIGYYVPHYLLQLFITYLENDPTRSNPAWGWLLAFGLFVSNAIMFTAFGVIWSISTTTLQAGIKLELNTLLFGKTLVKKDIAAIGDEKKNVGGVAEEAERDKNRESGDVEAKEDDEGVSSKTQIMVRRSPFRAAGCADETRRSLQLMSIA